jgi:hypothetical protein
MIPAAFAYDRHAKLRLEASLADILTDDFGWNQKR